MAGSNPKWVPGAAHTEVRRRKQVRLLVIGDDSATDSDSYYSHLKETAELCRHLYDVTCNFTDTGEGAAELMKEWEPTIILVDAHLENSSSIEIVRMSKAEAVPVVVTSDYPSSEIEQSFKLQGAAAYMPKTANPDDFEIILQKIVALAAEASIKH
jgi:DNA-binding NarL/FixJ family response regulator